MDKIKFGEHELIGNGSVFNCKYCQNVWLSVYDLHAKLEEITFYKAQPCISANEKIIKDIIE